MGNKIKYFISDIISDLCWFTVSLFPERVDVIHTENEKYLLRFHIKHCGKFRGIYLHHFFKGDTDRLLHNHPWDKSYSLILSGAYEEEKFNPKLDKKPIKKVFRRFNLNKLTKDDFHRVTLIKEPIWTLFTSKNKIQNWGFWDEKTEKIIPAEKFNVENNSYVTNLFGRRKELSEK